MTQVVEDILWSDQGSPDGDRSMVGQRLGSRDVFFHSALSHFLLSLPPTLLKQATVFDVCLHLHAIFKMSLDT